MNLLPKSSSDFSKKKYWDKFFKKQRGKKPFEWYGAFPELNTYINKYITVENCVLMIGCGDSSLSENMYDAGFRKLTNIDISKRVINRMIAGNKSKRPELKFVEMDALAMSFGSQSFDVVLDKGTLDALMPNDTPDVIARIDKLFTEIDRVLLAGGRYFCVTLLQEHILRHLVLYFTKINWMIRVTRCHEAEKKTAENGAKGLPVFVVICSKPRITLPILILETCLAGTKFQRHNAPVELINAIISDQESALIMSGLNRNYLGLDEEISLDLYDPSDAKTPRYSIYVLDGANLKGKGKYAAFIVPNGRETEWLFSTKGGRTKLLQTAGFSRLAVVTMHRGHVYTNIELVKEEIAESITRMAPPDLKDAIPYLSLNSEVGFRKTLHEGLSELSGPYVIEDITLASGTILRRLIFLNNQNIVQSEAKIKISEDGKKRKSKVVVDDLACDHHVYMVLGTYLICDRSPRNVAVVGLGGGGLVRYLDNLQQKLNITAVDIDPVMVEVANKWFGLVQNAHLKITIEDGITFLENAGRNGLMYDAILFDVDCKDSKLGMSCPPAEFLTKPVLDNVAKCVGNTGLFILNLVLRNDDLRKTIFSELNEHFKSIVSYKLEEDLNEIVYCKLEQSDLEQWKVEILKVAQELNRVVVNITRRTDEFIDLPALETQLKLYNTQN